MKPRGFLRTCVLLCMLFFITQNFAQETTNSIVRTTDDQGLQWGPCPDFMPKGCQIAILHGDPARKNVDVFFKVPANSDIPNHSHTSAERMILVSGEMDVTYKGEETQKIRTGDYAYGPAGKPHTAKCGNAGECILFIAFEEPLDAIPVKE